MGGLRVSSLLITSFVESSNCAFLVSYILVVIWIVFMFWFKISLLSSRKAQVHQKNIFRNKNLLHLLCHWFGWFFINREFKSFLLYITLVGFYCFSTWISRACCYLQKIQEFIKNSLDAKYVVVSYCRVYKFWGWPLIFRGTSEPNFWDGPVWCATGYHVHQEVWGMPKCTGFCLCMTRIFQHPRSTTYASIYLLT
jgi:hypothetical protein